MTQLKREHSRWPEFWSLLVGDCFCAARNQFEANSRHVFTSRSTILYDDCDVGFLSFSTIKPLVLPHSSIMSQSAIGGPARFRIEPRVDGEARVQSARAALGAMRDPLP
jgi:hypothetical protein